MSDLTCPATGAEIVAAINSKQDKPLAATDIGVPGEIGFGMGVIDASLLEDGWSLLAGHSVVGDDNYGHVLDPTGSVMGVVPRFYFKWNADNTLEISATEDEGFVLHRAFIDGGVVKDYFFTDIYQCGKVDLIFKSIAGIDPCSSHYDHNQIDTLANTPSGTNGGFYQAAKTRGSRHFITSIFIYNALAMLAYAHGKAGTNCAYSDVAPYLPKGNNNDALGDADDSSLVFTSSGTYANVALTGSGVPYAKTTHNGQNCGICDLNGNMWEVVSGLVRFTPGDFTLSVLKESVEISTLLDDSTTLGTGAYDSSLYEDVLMSDTLTNSTVQSFGNGSNQVFPMSTDRTAEAYKRAVCGLPMVGGASTDGTTEFGADYLVEYMKDYQSVIVGGHYGNGTNSGVFALDFLFDRNDLAPYNGGRCSYYLPEPV